MLFSTIRTCCVEQKGMDSKERSLTRLNSMEIEINPYGVISRFIGIFTCGSIPMQRSLSIAEEFSHIPFHWYLYFWGGEGSSSFLCAYYHV